MTTFTDFDLQQLAREVINRPKDEWEDAGWEDSHRSEHVALAEAAEEISDRGLNLAKRVTSLENLVNERAGCVAQLEETLEQGAEALRVAIKRVRPGMTLPRPQEGVGTNSQLFDLGAMVIEGKLKEEDAGLAEQLNTIEDALAQADAWDNDKSHAENIAALIAERSELFAKLGDAQDTLEQAVADADQARERAVAAEQAAEASVTPFVVEDKPYLKAAGEFMRHVIEEFNSLAEMEDQDPEEYTLCTREEAYRVQLQRAVSDYLSDPSDLAAATYLVVMIAAHRGVQTPYAPNPSAESGLPVTREEGVTPDFQELIQARMVEFYRAVGGGQPDDAEASA